MSDSQSAVQVAVKTALQNNAAFGTLVGGTGTLARIYDHVDQASAFPYVTLGDTTALPFDTKDKTGMEQTFTVHVWSRYRGRKEAQDIMAAAYGVLHRGTLTVTGHTFVNSEWEFSETFEDPDGLTKHGVSRYRIVTQQSGA